MSEMLEGKLVEILSAIQGAATKTADFALEQLPAIAQQYVFYGRVTSAVIFCVLILFAAIGLGAAYYAFNHPWNDSPYRFERDKKRSDSNYVVMYLGGICGVSFFLIAFLSFDYLVWFAPKVWLLQELAKLVK